MAKPVVLAIAPLPSSFPLRRRELREASRRLMAAHASVGALLDLLDGLRETKKIGGVKIAKLENHEADLLRAAIVFAAAGLESVLKELISGAIPSVVHRSKLASKRRATFLSGLVEADPSAVKTALATGNYAPLDTRYIKSFTETSLQSEARLKAVRDALGIPADNTFSDESLEKFRHFFEARNQIAHELDLKPSSGVGDGLRRTRYMGVSVSWCDDALKLAAEFIYAIDDQLDARLFSVTDPT